MGFRFRGVRDAGSMRLPSTVRARRSTIASCGWGAKGVWTAIFRTLASACRPPAHVLIDSSAVKAHRCASGGKGGTHAGNRPLTRRADNEDPRPTYDLCCPIAFLLTGGQVADCTAIDTLLEPIPATAIPHDDKGYDRDAVRRKIESKGVASNIPPKANRRRKNCFSPYLYRNSNAIERMFGRLRTSSESRPSTTASFKISSPPSALSLPSAIGYESGT